MTISNRLGKMPSWQRPFVLLGMWSASITGIMYLLGHEFQIQGLLLGSHSILVWHGIAAMIASIALGSILPNHLKAGWKSKRKLLSGISQLAFLLTLLITGALLYYGPEEMRDLVIMTHWLVGIAFALVFLLHSTRARKRVFSY
ncbi:hypothetical protein TUM22923_03210 [Polynucleobacter sp. TUM22923]|uniref:hypothetical protein n=1 Tax=Polynucleobacter sp. TUM22923 TaxID=3022126 RepID=UPI0025735BE9|nr:hypothetical protein [Polynucleobacter sp. TUM22923]BDX21000.1 hypothetical protein TUM22923_03210 [Polynucleobacter sp. TUM22923]